jgi:O-antigen ligase
MYYRPRIDVGGYRMVQEVRTANYPMQFSNRRFYLGVIALVCVVWIGIAQLGLSGALSLVLAVQIALFVLLFHRPVWAMASLMVGQLTASGFMFTISAELQISIRFLWTILTVALLVPILKSKGGIKLGNKARRIIIPAIIFFTLATIVNIVHVDLSYAIVYLRQASTALVILVLLPAVINNERDIKLLAIVALITCTASAVVAIMQHYSFMGLPAIALYPDTLWQGRISGLAEGPVDLAYNLPVIIMPMVAIYFLRGVNPRSRKILVILILVMTAALFFTYTRSGMYALAPGLLAIILLMKGKVKKELLLVVLILVAAFLYYSDIKGNRYAQGFADDSSAAGRLVLWQAGLNIALDNPLFGIGYSRFEDVSQGYASDIDPALMEIQNAGAVLGEAPHNDFLRVWLSFGTPAFLVFLWILVGIFRNFLDSYRQASSRFLKSLALGCFASLIAYSVNAATHNVMDSVFILWILGGFSIATTKLVSSKRPDSIKEL